MKIAQICYSGFGGLGSVVFSLISADHPRKHEWSVGFIGEAPLDASHSYQSIKNNIKFEYFKSISGRPYGAWVALAQWLYSEKPDVVICHSLNSTPACWWYCSRHNAKLIGVEHTSNRIKSNRDKIFSLINMQLANGTVLLTHEYRQELQKSQKLLFRNKRVRVVPNGIDTRVFSPSLRQVNSNSMSRNIRLGMAARFTSSKRQDLLVNVMSEMKKIRPDLSFELHFAGIGEELDRVREQSINSPSSLDIHFDGLLNESQVADWYRSLDVYVHATDGETLSTSLLQAMSTGLPIVASGVNGVINLLGSQMEYGLYTDNNIGCFSKAILSIVDTRPLSIARGIRARERILSKYCNRVMLESYLGFIADC